MSLENKESHQNIILDNTDVQKFNYLGHMLLDDELDVKEKNSFYSKSKD